MKHTREIEVYTHFDREVLLEDNIEEVCWRLRLTTSLLNNYSLVQNRKSWCCVLKSRPAVPFLSYMSPIQGLLQHLPEA
jgi:hypothetical protein